MATAPSSSPKANFLGIGAQKCATTWVHRVLLDHPQAAVSEPKELDFFSAAYHRGTQWYEEHFDVDALARGEISPSYFHDPLAPARAQAYNPDFRIVLMVRDPIARAYSNHLHDVRIGNHTDPDLSFESGMARNAMYVEQSLYARHLRRWLSCFAPERLLILIQEEIEKDPISQARRLYEFLGLDSAHQSAFLFRRVNQSYEEKLKGMNNFLRALGKFGRRLGIRALVEKVKGSHWVGALREANQRHLNEVVPPMNAETRKRLMELLAEDTQEFAQLVRRTDLPWPTLHEAMAGTPKVRVG